MKMKKPDNSTTIDQDEVEKFSKIADEWWDESGKFKPLHRFNPVRIKFIKEKIEENFTKEKSQISLLDIGCGGGLIAEPMTRVGFQVCAIDASSKNIEVARLHAKKMDLNIDYRHSSVEELVEKNEKKFDVVLALEIIEHVANPELFISHASSLVAKGGLLIVATINRNLKSLALAKFAAEYVLRWLPAGTHDWNKFLKPSEVSNFSASAGLELVEICGFSYNLFSSAWSRSSDLSMNYVAVFRK